MYPDLNVLKTEIAASCHVSSLQHIWGNRCEKDRYENQEGTAVLLGVYLAE